MRKSRTQRVDRTRAGGEWTEAAFWGFIRSGLRRMSVRWPPRKQCELAARREYDGPIKRQKFEYQCAICGDWKPRKLMQVDHIKPCGQLLSWDDLPVFTQRLFCEADGLQMVCELCDWSR